MIGASHYCYYQQVTCRGNSADVLGGGSCSSAAEEAIVGPGRATELHPVRDLPNLAKIIEKVVAQRFSDHLKAQNINELFQPAYRKLLSTETALLRVCSDVWVALDTINHNILLNRLCRHYGLQGCALQ